MLRHQSRENWSCLRSQACSVIIMMHAAGRDWHTVQAFYERVVAGQSDFGDLRALTDAPGPAPVPTRPSGLDALRTNDVPRSTTKAPNRNPKVSHPSRTLPCALSCLYYIRIMHAFVPRFQQARMFHVQQAQLDMPVAACSHLICPSLQRRVAASHPDNTSSSGDNGPTNTRDKKTRTISGQSGQTSPPPDHH